MATKTNMHRPTTHSSFLLSILILYLSSANFCISHPFSSNHPFVPETHCQPPNKPKEIDLGTTILAVRYKNGVVVGADTRTSVSGYVSNRFASKIAFVLESNNDIIPDDDPSACCCILRSGSSADTQFLIDRLREILWERTILQYGRRSSIANVAHILRSLIVSDDVSCSFLCAGYDPLDKRGVITSVSTTGSIMEESSYAASGSGSAYVLGYLDEHWDRNVEHIEEWQAVELVQRALELAMERDGGSGGYTCVYVIDSRGKRLMAPSVKKKGNGGGGGNNLENFAPAKKS